MIETIFFSENYLHRLPIEKRALWTRDFISSLFYDPQNKLAKKIDPRINYIRIIDIYGPCKNNYYEMSVIGGIFDEEMKLDIPLTSEMILKFKMQVSVTKASASIVQNPVSLFKDTTGIVYHKVQADILRNNLIQLIPELTVLKALASLPEAQLNFWTLPLLNDILSEITKIILQEQIPEIDSDFCYFPEKTNKLELKKLKALPAKKLNSFHHYELEVQPIHEEKFHTKENLGETIAVGIKFPTIWDVNTIYDPDKQFYSLLPQIKITYIRPKKYQANSLAKSMKEVLEDKSFNPKSEVNSESVESLVNEFTII